MKAALYVALGAASILAPAVHAAEITGTTIDLGYSTVSNTDLSKTHIGLASEIGFNRNLALQLDIGAYDFETSNDNGFSFGAHAIYHVSPAASVGAFVALDSMSGDHEQFVGIEAGYEVASFSGEAYASTGGSNGVDADVIGLGAAYRLTPELGLTGSIDHAELENAASLTSYALGVTYTPNETLSLYAEAGNLNADVFGARGDESFFGFGARIALGSDRGATFDRRGIFEFIPGF
jgi:hypothetical protein